MSFCFGGMGYTSVYIGIPAGMGQDGNFGHRKSMGILIWDNYRTKKIGLSSEMFDERRVFQTWIDLVYNMMGVVIGDIR